MQFKRIRPFVRRLPTPSTLLALSGRGAHSAERDLAHSNCLFVLPAIKIPTRNPTDIFEASGEPRTFTLSVAFSFAD